MTWDIAPAADIVTQPFGCVDYTGEWVCPGCGSGHFHAGVDLGSSAGGQSIFRTPVLATRPGVVSAIGIPYLGEQAVAVHTDEGVTIEHGHLDEAHVSVGQRVYPGDVLGLLGTKGASTAPHLHIEVRVDGPFQGVGGCPQNDPTRDPLPYLNKAQSMIAGLDSSTFRPSRDTALAAKAGGVGLWGGYLASKTGVGLYSPWDQASFDAVRVLPGKPIAYCSGWDDPVACASLARAWDVRLCLDVEGGGLRGDGDWIQGWIDAAGRDFCGLYGNYGIFAGRVAAFYVVGGYPGYDPAQTWGYVARPSGPCGWQWRGSADEYGGSVDRGTYDSWFTQGASTAPEEESMSYVIQGDQTPTCWVTDEISRRYIGNLGELERILERTRRPLKKVPEFDINRIPVSFRVPEDLTGTGLTSYDDVVFGPRRQAAPVSAGTASIPLQEATPPTAEWAPSPEEVQKLHSKLGFYPVVGADHKA